jgi:Alcohol dehydrogenase transcription factor Myb/SANT-like.
MGGHFEFDIEMLICVVEVRPVLWDNTDGIYKERNETKKAWIEVCICLKGTSNPKDVKSQCYFIGLGIHSGRTLNQIRRHTSLILVLLSFQSDKRISSQENCTHLLDIRKRYPVINNSLGHLYYH